MNPYTHPLLRGWSSPPRSPRKPDPIAGARSPAGAALRNDDGTQLLIRPIQSGDVETLQRAFKRLTPEQIRARLFHTLTELPEEVAHSMCNGDPDKVVALVITDADGKEIRGEGRAYFDMVTKSAEFGITIDPEFTGKGLGRALLSRLIKVSREQGMREIRGDTQADNAALLALTKGLGFGRHMDSDDARLVNISKSLIAKAGSPAVSGSGRVAGKNRQKKPLPADSSAR